MSAKGYVPYKPQEATKSVLRAAKHVLIQYRAHESPLTVRQVFYRLVQEFGYDKTEGAYGSLVNYIARSRRAFQHEFIEGVQGGLSGPNAMETALQADGLIPFAWIRDEKGASVPPTTWDDADEFIDNARRAAGEAQLDRQADQPRVLELWCEAAGMVPLMTEIAHPYSIRVSSGGGYDSVTAKHQLAQRVIKRWSQEHRGTTVLHIGDFDPSGEGMYETLEDDVDEMVWGTGGVGESFRVRRIALREDQVIEMGVETAPPKPLDARTRNFIEKHPQAVEHFGSEEITAQLEALTPDDLRELIDGAITENIVRSRYDEVLEREEVVREEMAERLGNA